MNYFWLNKNENKKLIVFFNGWAMNETPVKHLKTDGFDILVLYDYRNLDFDFSKFDFEKYTEKNLVCWSMGVYAVNKFKNIFENFNKKIAINGTTRLISNDFGIPEKIYKITMKFLNQENLDKFIKNMFDNGKLNPNITITRNLSELKDELLAIQNIVLDDEITFTKAIVSNDDRIIPTKNQLNFWQSKTTIEKINSTHCPFESFDSWNELLC